MNRVKCPSPFSAMAGAFETSATPSWLQRSRRVTALQLRLQQGWCLTPVGKFNGSAARASVTKQPVLVGSLQRGLKDLKETKALRCRACVTSLLRRQRRCNFEARHDVHTTRECFSRLGNQAWSNLMRLLHSAQMSCPESKFGPCIRSTLASVNGATCRTAQPVV